MDRGNLHYGQPVLHTGEDLARARGAVILLHGRGASAEDILGLSDAIELPGLAWFAPEAAGHIWWPNHFFHPVADNEPWLSSALAVVHGLVEAAAAAGIPAERTFVGGFSQGACLAAEYGLRHPRRWGGIFVLSGASLGPEGDAAAAALRPSGSFEGTPVIVACGDPDPYFDAPAVHRAASLFREREASVRELMVPGLGHQVSDESLEMCRSAIESALA
jgi:phospholipase/carboxylesterase